MIKIGEGCECAVYDVGDGTVFKNYAQLPLSYDEKVRYVCVCFELQTIAAEQGLAPKVFERRDMGYYSEKVTTYDELNFEEWQEYYDERDELNDKIARLFGHGWFDNHNGNFGILDDGSLCVIDFGLLGFIHTETGSRLREKYGIEEY